MGTEKTPETYADFNQLSSFDRDCEYLLILDGKEYLTLQRKLAEVNIIMRVFQNPFWVL
jgi:hypothetical protein